MSVIDGGVGLVLLLLGLKGFRSGLTGSLVWLGALMLTPYLAGHISPSLVAWMASDVPDLPEFLRHGAAVAVSLTVTGILVGLGLGFVVAPLRGMLYQLPAAKAADRVVGLAIALTAGTVGLGLLTILVSGLLSPLQRERLTASIWGSTVVPVVEPLAPQALVLLLRCGDADHAPDANPGAGGPAQALLASRFGGATPQLVGLLGALGTGSMPATTGGAAVSQALPMLQMLASADAPGMQPGTAEAASVLVAALSGGPEAGTGLAQQSASVQAAARLLTKALGGNGCAGIGAGNGPQAAG